MIIKFLKIQSVTQSLACDNLVRDYHSKLYFCVLNEYQIGQQLGKCLRNCIHTTQRPSGNSYHSYNPRDE